MLKFTKKATAFLCAMSIAFSAIAPIYATEGLSESEEILSQEVDTEEYTYEIAGLGEVYEASVLHLGASANYYNYKCEIGDVRQIAHVVTASVARGAFVRGVSLGDRLGARDRVSALKEEENGKDRILAATNADFFSTSTGVPMGVFVTDSRFVSSSDNRAAIGITKSGEVFIGEVGDSIALTLGSREYEISYLNKYPTVYGVYLLTRDFGETTRIPETLSATEYVIELNRDVTFTTRVRGRVIEIRKGTVNGEIPEDCAVLVVPDAYANQKDYEKIEKGDRVYIKATASDEFKNVKNAIGGGDVILRDGEIVSEFTDASIANARHPRTALGITEKGEIVMMVLDGRKAGVSNGVKLTALAEAMRDLGCVSAINLDGGGSSVMALFESDGAKVVNTPTDGSERKVPNALVVYENKASADKLHTLELFAASNLILKGARVPLSLAAFDADGEEVEVELSEDTVGFTVDERFGSVEFENGVPYFSAKSSGVGKILAKTLVKREVVSAEIFITVTSEIDAFKADQSIVLANTASDEILNITALRGEKEVYFGDLLYAEFEGDGIGAAVNRNTVTLSLASDAEAEQEVGESEETAAFFETEEVSEETVAETEEVSEETANVSDELPEETRENPTFESASGVLTLSLANKQLQIPVFYDASLSLDLGGLFADALESENGDYVLSFDGEVFRLEAPIAEVSEEVSETEEVTEEIAEEVTEEVTEEVAEEFTEEVAEEVVEETTFPEETTAPEEPEPIEEPEPTKEPEPTEIKINLASEALTSRGLSERRLWMWVDGLCADASPYAVFEADGEEVTVYYEAFYDFAPYNGRALLTLTAPHSDGALTLKTLLGFTTLSTVQNLEFHTVMLADELDTNLYADTKEHWSSFYVNSLSYMGIVNGSENLAGELVFTPDGGLSREQFAKILVNYLKINPYGYEDTEINFADVDEIAPWALPYVRAAVGEGLMRGKTTPADTLIFAPSDGITRQEALFVLGGLLGDVESAPLDFADGEAVAPWASENLEKALAAGLISGYDDGTIRPNGGITRAEAATVVVKLYTFLSKNPCILSQ